MAHEGVHAHTERLWEVGEICHRRVGTLFLRAQEKCSCRQSMKTEPRLLGELDDASDGYGGHEDDGNPTRRHGAHLKALGLVDIAEEKWPQGTRENSLIK